MKRIEFSPPKGFTLPEGSSSGSDIEVLSTYRVKPNGDLCLVALGDSKMPGYEDKPEYRDSGMEEAGERTVERYREKMEG